MSSMRWKLATAALAMALSASSPLWAQPPDRSAAAQVAANQVASFEIAEGEAGTTIRIKGSSVPTFSVFKLADPPRLFIDLSHSTLKQGDGEMRAVDNGVISQVSLIGVQDGGQELTRVIVGFEQAAHYDVRAEGNDVIVFIDGKKRRAPARLEERRDDSQELLERERRRYESELGTTRSRLQKTEQELLDLRAQLESSRGKQRAQLEQKIAAKNDEIDAARASSQKLEQKLAQADADRLAALQRAERAEAQVERSTLAQRDAQSQLESAQRREQELARQADLLKNQQSEARQQLATLQGRAEKLEREEAQARKQADTLQARAEKLEQELAQMRSRAAKGDASADSRLKQLERSQRENSSELTAAKSALADARAQRERGEAELERLKQQTETQRQQLTLAQRELSESEARSAELERGLARRDAQIKDRDAEIKSRDQQLERRAAELKAREQELARRDAELSSLKGQLTELQRERERLQKRDADLAGNDRQIAALQKKLDTAERALQTQRDVQAARPAARAVPVDVLADNTVRDIRLETEGGRSRIVVELDRPGNFETLPGRDSRAVMILNNTALPQALERTLAADAQGGAVRFVSSFIDQGKVRMEAELDGAAAETVRAEGNTLVWEFAPALAQQELAPLSQEGAPRAPEMGESVTSAPPMIVTDPTKVSRVPGMSRKRLTIDLRNSDVQNVLRLFSREGNVNIIAGADVKGSVTMRLRSVPLEEAFLIVLQSQGLGFEKRGNIIRVAPQQTLLDEQAARAAARQAEIDSQPLEVFLLPINYAQAGDLTGQIQGILSSRGSVTVDERTNTLIIKDVADNLDPIRVLIESLDTQVPQVLIEALIVETTDTFQREVGIQWGGNLAMGPANGNPTGLIFPSVLGLAGGATDGQTPNFGVGTSTPNYAVNLPAPVGTGSGGGIGLTMGSVGGGVNLNLRLTALEASGHARIQSAPKILTLDNTEASISQGSSIPISVVGAAGVQTVFVQAVLELTVTPHVTPDGNIQLRIHASKNEPDFQNTGARGDPTIIRRDAETELLIKDGDTTVIGGIYTRNAGTSLSAVPFLHKIPILGFFFRTTAESDRRNELLIFITPRIVNRAESLGVISAGAVQSAGSGRAAGGGAAGGGGGGGGGGGVFVQP